MQDEQQERTGKNPSLIARLHWAVFLGPALIFIFGGLSLRSKGIAALVLMVIGAVWGIIAFMTYRRSAITLTADRIHIQTGFLIRRNYHVLLKEISIVDLYQPSLGSMLNFGKLIIVHGKRTRTVVRMVDSPLEFIMELKRRVGNIHNQG